jgi:hypothetical protein
MLKSSEANTLNFWIQQMSINRSHHVNRRAAIKRFNHLLLGSATAYLVMTKSYQKPSLTKMPSLYDSAARAASVG